MVSMQTTKDNFSVISVSTRTVNYSWFITKGKTALLSIIPECYIDACILDYSMLSVPLSTLFEEEYMALLCNVLLQNGWLTFNSLKITEAQAKKI